MLKQFQNWSIRKNYLFQAFLVIVLISLSRDIENIYICISIYSICCLSFVWKLNKSYPYLIIVSLFLMFFLLFYKLDINQKLNFNIYKVVEVKEGYILLKQLSTLYYIPVGEEELLVGEFIKLSGMSEKVSVYGNFWEFDFNSYLINKNVKFRILEPMIEKTNGHFVQFHLYKFINSSNKLTKLFLFQQKTNDPIYTTLTSYSLSFLINLSGFNIYIISCFFNKKIFKNSKKYKKYKIIILALVLYYCGLLSFPLFFLKTCIFLIIRWIEENWKFRFSKITKFSIIWIICLFINPLFVFNIGFIFTIIAFLFIKKYQDKKPITNLFYNFLIVNAVFIPVQIYFDYKIYWLSSFFEILLIPLISFSFILSTFFWIPFSSYLLDFNYQILYSYSKSFQYINIFTICGHFSIFFLITYFFMFKLITTYKFNRRKIQTILIMLFTLNGFYFLQSNQFTKISPSVTMLNVGNGNSFLLQYKGKNILFDAGKGSGFSKKSLQQYLVYDGVRKIDAIFISHNHKDHYDQIDDLKTIYNIQNIFYNYDNQFNFKFKDLKISNFIENQNKDENDNSQVSVVEVKGKKILFTGDISKKREARLLQNKEFLEMIKGGVDLLQVAHHGSKTSSSQLFIETIKPQKCFISGHKSKMYDFPSKETIATLKKYQCKTYITNSRNSYKYKVKSNKVIKVQKKLLL